MSDYSVMIRWSDEDEGYIATSPELSGLSAFGDTPEEALGELKIARDGYLEVFKEDGCDLPNPQVVKSYSGQLRLRLPKSLHEALSIEAQNEGVSLNSYISNLLSERHIAHRLDTKLDRIESEVIGLIHDSLVAPQSLGAPAMVFATSTDYDQSADYREYH
jgi:predicted RNase H-like HicB family nuclease